MFPGCLGFRFKSIFGDPLKFCREEIPESVLESFNNYVIHNDRCFSCRL